jgi:hypothetical protein
LIEFPVNFPLWHLVNGSSKMGQSLRLVTTYILLSVIIFLTFRGERNYSAVAAVSTNGRYYSILGVDKDANENTIKKVFSSFTTAVSFSDRTPNVYFSPG